MVIRYKCKNCGTILYEFKEAKDPVGLLTPREVAFEYNFVCPKCKATLNPDLSKDWKKRIIVKPAKKSKP
jgi:rubredoxin